MRTTTIRLLTLASVLALGLTACGGTQDAGSEVAPEDTGVSAPEEDTGGGAGGAAGTCPEGTEDCIDTPGLGRPVTSGVCAEDHPDCDDTVEAPVEHQRPGGADDEPHGELRMDPGEADAALREAAALLGAPQADLPDDVRVARVGDERLMLTEDYVLGRLTAELDPDADGTMRVTSVTVELPGGPEVVD